MLIMRGKTSKNPRNAREITEDPQQKKVYAWEREWVDWNTNSLSIHQCRRIIEQACDLFNVEHPLVHSHKGRYWSWQQEDLIDLQDSGDDRPGYGQMNKPVALHEAAHYIHWRRGGRGQTHGPTWLGIYMRLLEEFKVAPRLALWATAAHKRLRWSKCEL